MVGLLTLARTHTKVRLYDVPGLATKEPIQDRHLNITTQALIFSSSNPLGTKKEEILPTKRTEKLSGDL